MIDVQGLQFTYPGSQTPALKDLNFKVGQGEVFGFLGPSGAGKSTTQRILIGLIRGYQGRVCVFGEPLQKMGRRYFEKIGVGFELPNTYGKLTALENLRFFAAMYPQKGLDPQDLLEKVGLLEQKNTRVSEFSKGMKMRLNFCRALLPDPPLVFLDEPTSGQDPKNARRLRELILGLKQQGTTVFLTTHNMSEATELCDRVAFIVDGALTLVDEPQKLMLRFGKPRVEVRYLEGQEQKCESYDLGALGQDESFQHILKTKVISTIHSQEATLEDVFMQTTGRQL